MRTITINGLQRQIGWSASTRRTAVLPMASREKPTDDRGGMAAVDDAPTNVAAPRGVAIGAVNSAER
jgi:hypothetical protein